MYCFFPPTGSMKKAPAVGGWHAPLKMASISSRLTVTDLSAVYSSAAAVAYLTRTVLSRHISIMVKALSMVRLISAGAGIKVGGIPPRNLAEIFLLIADPLS